MFGLLVRRLRLACRVVRQVPRGLEVCFDLGTLARPTVIFDVGAHIGQSATRFLSWFPDAAVYCFEPSEESLTELRKRLNGRVQSFQIALGSQARKARLAHTGTSDTFRIAAEGEEEVTVQTIDDFCGEMAIEQIDFLKIDTEGHDLQVLRGAESMLRQGRISAIQVEAGMNPENELHVHFDVLRRHLEERGYRLFGLYDQVAEWPTRQPHLRRTNPLFIRKP